MRILIWSGSYPPELGGVSVVVHGLARSLAARGETVQVVTQSRDGESATDLKPEGVVHRLPFHQVLSSRDPARVIALTGNVAEIKRNFQPDLVHVHAVHPSEFFLLRTATVAPCPVIFTLHGWTPMASGQDTLRERMLRGADWVTGCSQHVVDRAILEVPDVGGRSRTIYNGCSDPGLRIAPLPFDPPRLLCVGRLVESKGFDRVLRVLPAVVKSHPAIRLTIVGDGPCRPELERECAGRDLITRTEFVGEVSRDRVFAYLNAATLLVVPSRDGSEGLPMVALEAALMERPVVAARDGGLAEAVVDGETGFLIEGGDLNGLGRSILRVVANSELATRIGRAARRYVLDRFDWEAQLTNYSNLYESAAGKYEKT